MMYHSKWIFSNLKILNQETGQINTALQTFKEYESYDIQHSEL